MICSIVLALLLGILLTLTRSAAWVMHPIKFIVVWLILAAFQAWIYLVSARTCLSAGADWVARRRRWVSTYELVKVTCHAYPYWGVALCMRDSGWRKLRYRFIDLSSDRLMWDLTYNGILYSAIINNAKTNGTFRRTLPLLSLEPPSGSGT